MFDIKCEMKKLRGIRHFFAAFGYSMSGLCFAIKEAAIRHELLLGRVHFIALHFAGFTILWIFLLSDVLGNVMEICRDRIAPNKNLESSLNLEKDGLYEFIGGRVETRSGSKKGDSTSLRSAYRVNSSLTSSKEETMGFRISLTLP